MKRHAATLLPLLVLWSAACKKETPAPAPATVAAAPTTTAPGPVSVARVTLGRAVAENKTVAEATERFAAKDTIYASVATAGAGHAKLRALWSFVKGEKIATTVDEAVLEIDATGPAVNEFHVSKPSGWPKGDYKVEIFVNEASEPAATKSFKVN